jgi:hypothetical protein
MDETPSSWNATQARTRHWFPLATARLSSTSRCSRYLEPAVRSMTGGILGSCSKSPFIKANRSRLLLLRPSCSVQLSSTAFQSPILASKDCGNGALSGSRSGAGVGSLIGFGVEFGVSQTIAEEPVGETIGDAHGRVSGGEESAWSCQN